jgi:hypothetical protein
MKYLKYVVLVALLAMPLAYSQAEVRVGVGIGVGVGGYVAGPPVCSYGYYPDYPYGCAPYGYYGPSWFANGIFIGAGPWYHGFGRPFYPGRYGRGFDGRFAGRGFTDRGYAGRGFSGHEVAGHGAVGGRGFESRGPVGGGHGGFRGRR